MPRRTERICTVSVSEAYSRDEVLLNFDRIGANVRLGSLMSIAAVKADNGKTGTGYGLAPKAVNEGSNADEGTGPRYTFVAKDMAKDPKKSRQSDVEVLVAKHIALAFGMKNGSQVLLTAVGLLETLHQ